MEHPRYTLRCSYEQSGNTEDQGSEEMVVFRDAQHPKGVHQTNMMMFQDWYGVCMYVMFVCGYGCLCSRVLEPQRYLLDSKTIDYSSL